MPAQATATRRGTNVTSSSDDNNDNYNNYDQNNIQPQDAPLTPTEEEPISAAPVVSASTLYDRFFLNFPFTTKETTNPSSSTTPPQPKDNNNKKSLLPSYIMNLPFDSFRFVLTILLLVSLLSLTVTSNDLDSQLARRHSQHVSQKRATSNAPSFRIGPKQYNPQKEHSSSRGVAFGVVIGISIIIAGLMS